MKLDKRFLTELFKYGIVGVMNTLITAFVIWFLMHVVFQVDKANVSAMEITVSNVVGYIAGLINSFLWNRSWTFHSQSGWKSDSFRFIIAFLICYIPQLILVNVLNRYTPLSGYACQLIGIVFYTGANFLCNKYYTFRK
ncbi:MAG: GtrA family protein [Dysgonamonadaceae bacterium]|jgi:putative flippase GtrA|nr:GtrA family protein [Dysgonamonadaceae bacterium]